MAQEDLTAALQEISASISTSLRDGVRQIADEVGQLKQQAAASNQQVEKIVRDLYTAISIQTKSIASVQQSIDREEKTEVKTEAVAERAYTLEQQQIQGLDKINATLGNLTKALRQGFADLNSSQQSLAQTLTDGKKGFTNPLAGIGNAYAEGGLYQAGGFALGRGIRGLGLGAAALGGAAISNAGGLAAAAELNDDVLKGIPSSLRQQLIDRLGIPKSDAPKAEGTGISPVGSSGFSGDGGGLDKGNPNKKINNIAQASEIYQYLLSKGVDKNHALGMLANIKQESNFNSGAYNKNDVNGPSGGLFQHHDNLRSGERRFSKMVAYASQGGKEWQKNWKAQIDFALSEPDTQKFLSRKVSSGEEAAGAFVYDFERPADKAGEARKRASYVAALDKQLGSGVTQTGSALASKDSGSGGGGASPGNIVAQDSPGGTSLSGAAGGDSGATQKGGDREYAALQSDSHHGILSGLPSAKESHDGSGAGDARRQESQEQTKASTQIDKSAVTGKSLDGVNSDLMNKFFAAATEFKEKTGRPVNVTSGTRTAEKQAELYAAYKAGRGNPANPPGKSNHETGNAIDSSDTEQMQRLGILQRHGLAQTVGSRDPVHIQLAGTGSSQASYGSSGSGGGDRAVAQDAERVSSTGSNEESIGPSVPVSQRPGALGGGALGTYGVEAFQASGVGPRSGIPSSVLTSSLATGAPLGIGGGVPGGASGLLGQLIPNITGAGQNAQIEEFSNRSAMNEAKQLKMQEQLNGILSQQQQQSAAQYADTNWPQKGTDYNNASDISFGPAWPEIVGQAYPEYGDKVRLNPFKRR